jgi:hypothetical protein
MSSGYFDDLVGPLKRAAIDAYMRSESVGAWQIEGDRYTLDSANGGDAYVTRPGEDGEGGGDWETDNFVADLFGVDRDQEFKSAFDDIRSDVDKKLNRWRDIPKGEDLTPLVEAMRQACRKLSTGAKSSDGAITGGGEIAGNLSVILENSDAMGGGMITAFKTDFLAQLGKAVGGQHAIAIVLGGHLAAQEKMWAGARESVVDLIKDSTAAFNAAAKEGEVDWKVVLKVTGYVVAGVTLFATEGVGSPVVDLGLKVLDDALKEADESTEKPAPTYDSVKEAFARDLKSLDTKIQGQEERIDENIIDNLGNIRSDAGSYDLSRPPLLDVDDDSDLGKPEEIQIDPILVKEISGTCMPNIADELYAAQKDVDDAADTSVLFRDASLGVGEWGPSPKWGELRWLLWELLGNLAWEIKNSAKTLELAVEDIGQADSSSKDALEKHADDVADQGAGTSGGPDDPWNQPPTHGV